MTDAPPKKRGRPFQPGQSGNPAGRKPGTGRVAKFRAAIEEHVPEVIAAMLEAAKNGDPQAARLLLERGVPALRPVDQAVAIALPGATPSELGRSVIEAVADGRLTPDQGGQLLGGLANLARLIEADELERRIAALEGARDGTA